MLQTDSTPQLLLVSEKNRCSMVNLDYPESRIATDLQFQYPTGLARLGDDLYAAEQNLRGVHRFLANGASWPRGSLKKFMVKSSVGSMDADESSRIESALGVAAGDGMILSPMSLPTASLRSTAC